MYYKVFNRMRNIVFTFLMLIIAQTSIGQTKDYKDLYKSLGSMTDFEAFWMLFQYLQATTSREYANSNAYYHVGLIMQKCMRDSDPFVDTRNVQNYIKQAELYFGLSKRSLEEKDFKRHVDFYPTVKPAGQKLAMSDVVNDIDERISDVIEFKERFNESLSYLVKSVNSYNYCITTFAKINQENSRLNDLYFLVDEQLSNNLNELGENFDSTMFYLDKFKTSLEEYPLGDYKINYSLKQIPVYRLYGLNSSNFLSENINLWDFRTWVNNFHEILDTDVAFLYKNAQEINRLNTSYIKSLLDMNTSNIEPNYKMNPLIVNKMLKYDFNSATAALLSFQEAKVNYLYSIADNRIGSELVSFDCFSKSPDAFINIAQKKQETDKLLSNAKAKATVESIEKYAKFYKDNYNGFNGYERYLNLQADENELTMRNAMNYYKDLILKSYIRTGIEKTIVYNGKPIVFQITTPAIMGESAGYYIHSKTQITNNGMFIAGTHVADNQKHAFAAVIDSAGTVQWLKEYKQANIATHATLTAQTNDGYAVVISSIAANAVKNRILLIDATSGNVRTTKDFPFTAIPQQLVYDDISQTYVLALKGTTYMPFFASSAPLQIAMLDAKLDIVWAETITFDGYIVNVVKTDDNYYVYGAYRRLTDKMGKLHFTDENAMNMFVYPISARGDWLSVTLFEEPFSYYPLNVVKINNEYVDVISLKDEQPDRLIEGRSLGGKPYYMVIYSNRDIQYQFNK